MSFIIITLLMMLPDRLYFFTATINKWIPILQYSETKQIVLNSLKFLISENAIKLSAFVIMPNHIHLILMPLSSSKYSNVKLSFLRYTGQQLKFYMLDHNQSMLEKFLVNKKDRTYQIWKRNSLAIELFSRNVVEQKLDYVHSNPVQEKWRLSKTDLEYEYSSIRFYEESEEYLPFLTHYMDLI